MKYFRVVPTLSYNPMTDGMDVSFVPSVGKSSAMLEDSLELLEKVSSAENRLIVVFDEFQEVNSIDKTLAKQLRAIMQRQKGLNYIFMGSQESMMEEIRKSPAKDARFAEGFHHRRISQVYGCSPLLHATAGCCSL